MNFLKPFDIVSSYYVDLNGDVKSYDNGKPQRALFLVIAVDSGNVIACKITSQQCFHSSVDFVYTLRQESHPFLQTDSYLQISKPHTLSTYSCTKVGEVAQFCRPFILKQLKSLFDTLTRVVSVECPISTYTSPNKKYHSFAGQRIIRK